MCDLTGQTLQDYKILGQKWLNRRYDGYFVTHPQHEAALLLHDVYPKYHPFQS